MEHSVPSQSVQSASSPPPAPSPAVRWLSEHGDALYAYALRRVRRTETAEDLVQETLLAALSARDAFAERSSERTWLIGILKHKLIDHLRQSLRQQQRVEVEIDDVAAEFFDGHGGWKIKPRAWPSDPRLTLENAEFHAALLACLAKLPPRIAQTFWLREGEGHDSDWLCKELGISPTNLWAMLHRARLGLRRCLSATWFGKDEKPE